MSLEAYGDEGEIGCEGCAELEGELEELRAERDALLAKVKRLSCPFADVIGPLEHESNGCCT